MSRAPKIPLLLIAGILLFSVSAYSSTVYLKQFDFNTTNALDKWAKMIMKGQVKYLLMKQGTNGYVEALSEKSCSALYYRIGYKLKEYPVISWKWRVMQFPDKSKAKTEKERDDYAARVYVIFPFLSFSSSKFIEYVWADDLPVGTVKDSPNGSNIKLIVVRSGKGAVGQWFAERRNAYEDYKKAFGKEPGMSVGAVAIMSDAEATQSVAEASFDDIAITSADEVAGRTEGV